MLGTKITIEVSVIGAAAILVLANELVAFAEDSTQVQL
jgi:hypothetical protein